MTLKERKSPEEVLNRTVVVDSGWPYDNLCGSLLHFDSENHYCTGCQNVSHCQQQQSHSGLHSPGRPYSTYLWIKPFTVLLSLASSLCFIQCLHNVTYMFASTFWNLLLLQDFLWRIIFMCFSLRYSIVSGIGHFFIVQTISRNWTYIKLRRFICCRYRNIFSGSDCVWLSTHRTVWSFRSNSHTFI